MFIFESTKAAPEFKELFVIYAHNFKQSKVRYLIYIDQLTSYTILSE